MKETEAAALLAAGGAAGGAAVKKRHWLRHLWRKLRHGKRAAAHAETMVRRRPGESDEAFAYRVKVEAANLVRRRMK